MCAGAMSEDDRDIDVESADDVPDIGMEATASCQSPSLGLGVSAATCATYSQNRHNVQHAYSSKARNLDELCTMSCNICLHTH